MKTSEKKLIVVIFIVILLIILGIRIYMNKNKTSNPTPAPNPSLKYFNHIVKLMLKIKENYDEAIQFPKADIMRSLLIDMSTKICGQPWSIGNSDLEVWFAYLTIIEGIVPLIACSDILSDPEKKDFITSLFFAHLNLPNVTINNGDKPVVTLSYKEPDFFIKNINDQSYIIISDKMKNMMQFTNNEYSLPEFQDIFYSNLINDPITQKRINLMKQSNTKDVCQQFVTAIQNNNLVMEF